MQPKPNAARLEPFSLEEQRRRWRLIAEAILNDPGRTDQAEKSEPEQQKAA